MASLNKVMLIGNLGKDPEVRYTASGMAVASFSLATSERFKGKNGEFEGTIDYGEDKSSAEAKIKRLIGA